MDLAEFSVGMGVPAERIARDSVKIIEVGNQFFVTFTEYKVGEDGKSFFDFEAKQVAQIPHMRKLRTLLTSPHC